MECVIVILRVRDDSNDSTLVAFLCEEEVEADLEDVEDRDFATEASLERPGVDEVAVKSSANSMSDAADDGTLASPAAWESLRSSLFPFLLPFMISFTGSFPRRRRSFVRGVFGSLGSLCVAESKVWAVSSALA